MDGGGSEEGVDILYLFPSEGEEEGRERKCQGVVKIIFSFIHVRTQVNCSLLLFLRSEDIREGVVVGAGI
jgi:hypothetical protein